MMGLGPRAGLEKWLVVAKAVSWRAPDLVEGRADQEEGAASSTLLVRDAEQLAFQIDHTASSLSDPACGVYLM